MRKVIGVVLSSLVLGTMVAVAPSAGAVTAAALQTHHTVAVTVWDVLYIGGDGRVYGSGLNISSEITGTGERSTATALTGLPTGVRATAIAAGDYFSLVLGSDGQVYGTGINNFGQLTGTESGRSTLTRLSGLPTGVRAAAIAAGNAFSLVLGSDGRVYGAGADGDFQLTGTGAATVTTLTALTGLGSTKAVAIAGGGGFTVVLGANGRVYGAGDNSSGVLTGSAATIETLTPFSAVPFGIGITQVAAGEGNVVLLGTDGYAYATGDNIFGQLDPTPDDDAHSAPVRLPVRGVVAVVAGFQTIGLIEADGAVSAAGDNADDQLTTSIEPVTQFLPMTADGSVAPTGGAIDLALGSDSVVRDSHGIVYAAGRDDMGQITVTPQDDGVTALIYVTGQKVIDTTAPTITGTAAVGKTLTAHAGSWQVTATHYAYQWLRNGVAIHAATGTTYKLTSADKGHKVSVKITATRTGFTTGTATSAARGPITS